MKRRCSALTLREVLEPVGRETILPRVLGVAPVGGGRA